MMGRLPHEVDRCSVPAFLAAFDGFVQAQGGKAKDAAPSQDEYVRILAQEQAAGRA